MDYIEQPKPDGCVFCEAASQPDSLENLIVHRARSAFVIVNRYPYTSGHLMVVPFAHTPTLQGLDPAVRAEMIELANLGLNVLQGVYHPQGFNLGVNIGEAAGAGIEEHVHLHVVPRWAGDTNFMSSLGRTRVLPESLAETYRRVRSAWEA
jgi:ATP adenylyltransferase